MNLNDWFGSCGTTQVSNGYTQLSGSTWQQALAGTQILHRTVSTARRVLDGKPVEEASVQIPGATLVWWRSIGSAESDGGRKAAAAEPAKERREPRRFKQENEYRRKEFRKEDFRRDYNRR